MPILKVLYSFDDCSEMYEYVPKNKHMYPPGQYWKISSMSHSGPIWWKKMALMRNQRLYERYPKSGRTISIFLPNLSDQGPMKSVNMIGGMPLMYKVTALMSWYAWFKNWMDPLNNFIIWIKLSTMTYFDNIFSCLVIISWVQGAANCIVVSFSISKSCTSNLLKIKGMAIHIGLHKFYVKLKLILKAIWNLVILTIGTCLPRKSYSDKRVDRCSALNWTQEHRVVARAPQ